MDSALQASHRPAFRKPVVVRTRKPGRDRVVTTVEGAAMVLLHDWPETDGRFRERAVRGCIRALNGEWPVNLAREWFVAAAEDVGIFIGAGE